LDNVIVSGRARKELGPPEEMRAVEMLDRLHEAGRIKLVTSKWTRIEQARTKDPAVVSVLAAHAGDLSVVQPDSRVLGFSNLDYGRRGFISSPIMTDIVDDDLHAKLRGAGVEEDDAMHVMYAVASKCEVFLTLDTRDILPIRSAIEAICSPLRILTPTELIAELAREERR
jgi:hypothetical protein